MAKLYFFTILFSGLLISAAYSQYQPNSPANIDNTSASYKNSSANYENSSANFDNSSASFENSSANFENSSANVENSGSSYTSEDDVYDSKGNSLGYMIRKSSSGIRNIFDSTGTRIGYIGVDGKAYDNEDSLLGSSVSRPGGGISIFDPSVLSQEYTGQESLEKK